MQELLNELLKTCKTLKQLEKELNKKHIDYEYHDGLCGKEIKLEDKENHKVYYRVVKDSKQLRIIKMNRLVAGVDIFTAESKLKAQMIHDALSYK